MPTPSETLTVDEYRSPDTPSMVLDGVLEQRQEARLATTQKQLLDWVKTRWLRQKRRFRNHFGQTFVANFNTTPEPLLTT